MDIEEILKNVYPELKVDIPSMHGKGLLSQNQLEAVFRQIKDKDLIQNAVNLIYRRPVVKSITYCVPIPGNLNGISFGVEFVTPQNLFIGRLMVADSVEIREQVRLYGIHASISTQ